MFRKFYKKNDAKIEADLLNKNAKTYYEESLKEQISNPYKAGNEINQAIVTDDGIKALDKNQNDYKDIKPLQKVKTKHKKKGNNREYV